MASPIVSTRLIHIHPKARQSVTSADNQTCQCLCFCGVFDNDVKSVNF